MYDLPKHQICSAWDHADPAQAIDEIGWTNYHWKLFVLNGFGYAVDSLLTLLQSIVQPQADLEFNPAFKKGLTIALYVGLLVGAIFWGLTADMIGMIFRNDRKSIIAHAVNLRSAVRVQYIAPDLFDIFNRGRSCSQLAVSWILRCNGRLWRGW